jgi:long-subunit acyl-CoA synthetase (AMP-forming)
MVGGRLRGIVTGSAPLDGNVHKFIQTCFNCPVRQGYGATETSAASVVQELMDSTAGLVGPPRVSCCLKLVDWVEGNYRVADQNDPSIGVPRGEIAIGGELVALGYLIDPENPDAELEEKNRTSFQIDEKGIRWFHTGDIGQVDANGCLKIIDRKSDLVKLQQGEYVALSKVEGVLKLSTYVENALVHAMPIQKYCTALVCPSVGALKAFCTEQNIDFSDLEAVCANPLVVAEVLRSCKEVSKGKLSGFEIPEKLTIIPPSRTWTPENDLLTAAMKLKRRPIIEAHRAEIEKMYA